MARARNIKPGFFNNEDLAECSLAARLCFAGLWTLADREGRLEDRPKRIKGELFRFDSLDVEPLLKELAHRGFILRYEVDGRGLIQVVAFHKHQNPTTGSLQAICHHHQALGSGLMPTHQSPGRRDHQMEPRPRTSPRQAQGLTPQKTTCHPPSAVWIPEP